MLTALRNKLKALWTAFIIDSFHRLYYHSSWQTWQNTRWMGVKTLKLPLDLWVYQEILFECQPDYIIETGTKYGGSACYLASLCDVIGKGQVVTIDIEPDTNRPQHPRVTYLLGSSLSDEIHAVLRDKIQPGASVMVILDADHSAGHVSQELKLYANYVSPGHYLIVEDTNVNGHPVFPAHGPGPMEAVRRYLEEDTRFKVDASREKLMLTFNPKGFLKKLRE